MCHYYNPSFYTLRATIAAANFKNLYTSLINLYRTIIIEGLYNPIEILEIKLNNLDSKPLLETAWYTLFAHASKSPRIGDRKCSIFISILIPL